MLFRSLEIPQHGQITHLSLRTRAWNNVVYENVLFVPILYHLQILEIVADFYERGVLNVLPFCHELRELGLFNVDIPLIAHDVDLPLVHTLQKLFLRRSTIAWMDGLVFTQLQRFDLENPSSLEIFKQKVRMPACTHIVFGGHELNDLPVFQSNFHLPFLDTFDLSAARIHDDERVISALHTIHAKRFMFCINRTSSLGLLELLESKDEVEQLDLEISNFGPDSHAETTQFILTRMSVANNVTMKVPCPNMKVLRLQFENIWGANKEQVSESCRKMMNNRQLAGYLMERCYIWWNRKDRKKHASLVLVMENEVARVSSSS